MGNFAVILVLFGALIFVLSLKPINQLLKCLPPGSCRVAWKFLSGLIAMFFVGYLVYAYLFYGKVSHWGDMVVPAIFFFGAVFVLTVCTLSAKTAAGLLRICHLEHENITDPLMNIYNRRHLDRCLVEEASKVKRYGIDLSAMMIDVDHFKLVNDNYGHSVGDQVLQALALLIKGNIRDFDLVFRFGGEEIVVLLPYTNANGALILANRLREWVSERRLIKLVDEKKNITISIGVSCYQPEYEKIGDMLTRADEALYQAKENGRNRVEVAPAPSSIT